VVDDAIMVLENIVRHQEMGQNRMQAASNGARQITFAATAATFAVIAIFLPVAFMKGVIGTFFFQFGVTLSVAVLLSLLEALTLTPMRASQFVTVKKRKNWLTQKSEKMFHNLSTRYENILHTLLSHRWKVLLASLLFFVLSLTTTTWLRKEFVPSQDQSMFMVNMQTPVGSSIEFTDERFKQAEALLLKRPEVTRYFAAVGGFGGGEVNSGIIFITLKPPRERNVSQQEVMDWARKSFNAIPDLKAFVVDFSNRGFGAQRGTPIEFTVRGHDWGDLVEASEAMRKRMEKDPIFTDVNTGYQADTPEIQIIPDRIKAAAHGVSVTTIAETVNLGFGGMRAGRYPEGSRKIDVRVMLQKSDRQKANDVQDLFVRNNRGELIPLTEVTRLEEKPALLTISRKDRERAITITSNVAVGRSQADAIKKVETWGKELPEGYHLVLTGAAKTFQESFGNLGFALWLGVIIAYMILAAQYNSYIHPFTVLLALPFSISGAFLALLITQNSLNLYSMIGLLLLMGIVKKNSILLVDFTNQVRKDGKNVREALLHACPIRLRPILMTSAATIAAAIPPALGIGPGAETRIPMAVVIIGGVLVSTVLTLFVVPCAYSLLAQLERKPHRTP
ncbi:MAG: efflux RND transporter permease subunit, partial [Deltaproteobacteria bacterium]|nr:efflux RND transporter permease subunit [Deltaproteobacteria bacterium]